MYSFTKRVFSLLGFCLMLSGCFQYEDIYLSANKAIFYGDDGVIKLLNEQTGQVVTLQAGVISCHRLGPVEMDGSDLTINRFHPELCGQRACKEEGVPFWLDHSISSEDNPNSFVYRFFFRNASFYANESLRSPSAQGHYLSSLVVGGVEYTDVFVCEADTLLPEYPRVDSLFVTASKGIIKLVSSDHQTWIRQ